MSVTNEEKILPSDLKEKENSKCSCLQDIVFMVRLALYAPSCIANVSGFNAIFLPEECLWNTGLLTVFSGSEAIQNLQVRFIYLS